METLRAPRDAQRTIMGTSGGVMADTPVSGTPRALLRIEGATMFVAAVVAYRATGGSWGVFAALFLAPDLGLIAYAAGPRVGAHIYNALHTYVGPALLAGLAYTGVSPHAWSWCAVWLAHIGMDRAVGFGLKFTSAASNTHLGLRHLH